MKQIIISASIIFLMAACTPAAAQPAATNEPTQAPQPDLPNPASAYCQEQGGQLEIRTATDGSQNGYCVFPDGSECEEWSFYRGDCQPLSSMGTPAVNESTSSREAEIASDGCKIYRNTAFGYSFHYPADAEIVQNDDPLGGITVSGPVKNNSSWPTFGVSHPTEREEYRPPENSDLLQWLSDHYLLGENRAADVLIAGRTAIHMRHDRSPQSYASDIYFFTQADQLYSVIIIHTGDLEDWELYNHFLDSFQFEEVAAGKLALAAPLTVRQVDPSEYQGWWTYRNPEYSFSLQLPEDWVVDETTTFDSQVSGHGLVLHPEKSAEQENIRMTFRLTGEETLLWPTGASQGNLVPDGALVVAGQAARRIVQLCPTGEVTSIWYHGAGHQPNIVYSDLEFGFIYTGGRCEPGANLAGKKQWVAEMIIASLQVS